MKAPSFRHPLSTKEGRHERAVWTFLNAQEDGVQASVVVVFLKKKGMSDSEIMEALNEASSGVLIQSTFS